MNSTDRPPTDPVSWNRVYGDQLDAIGMKLARALFSRIDECEQKQRGVYVAVIEERSTIRLDDRYLGAWRGTGMTLGAMHASLDALVTLKLVLERDAIPMTALYPLLRAAVENAALAIYLLAPESRDERLTRFYWVAADDARLRSVYERERGSNAYAAKLEDVHAEIRGLISTRPSLGDPAAFTFPRVQYSDLVAKAGAALDADTAVKVDSEMSLLAIWQLLSGLSHGKQWAMIEVLERSDAVVIEEEQSAQVRLTTSPAVVSVFLLRAIQTLECALRLYGRRTKAWTSLPEDAAEPEHVTYSEMQRKKRSGPAS